MKVMELILLILGFENILMKKIVMYLLKNQNQKDILMLFLFLFKK